jgi:four helix bundle protein
MAHRDLRLLAAAEQAARMVNGLIDGPLGRRLLHVIQMRRSAQAITANIAEGFARGAGKDRARILRIAKSEAEETISHVRSNFTEHRIAAKTYWPIHNLLVVIVRMLNAIIYGKSG